MSEVTVDIEIVDNQFPELPSRIRKKAQAACRRAGRNIIANARRYMREPKSGIVYNRPGRLISYSRGGRIISYERSGPPHQASAPGEAPAIDTKVLYNSMELIQNSETEWQVLVNAPYSADLEFGTKNMEARPYLQPAVDEVTSDWLEELGGTIEASVK